jgi:hypothetical protein
MPAGGKGVEVELTAPGPLGIELESGSMDGLPRVHNIVAGGQMSTHPEVEVGMTLLAVDGQVVTSMSQCMPLMRAARRPVRLRFSAASAGRKRQAPQTFAAAAGDYRQCREPGLKTAHTCGKKKAKKRKAQANGVNERGEEPQGVAFYNTGRGRGVEWKIAWHYAAAGPKDAAGRPIGPSELLRCFLWELGQALKGNYIHRRGGYLRRERLIFEHDYSARIPAALLHRKALACYAPPLQLLELVLLDVHRYRVYHRSKQPIL